MQDNHDLKTNSRELQNGFKISFWELLNGQLTCDA